MHVHDWRRLRAIGPLVLAVILVLAACASPAAAPTEAEPTPTETPEPTEEPSPTEDERGDDEPGVDGPADVEAGAEFEVSWTGPDAPGDYIALVPEGAEEWKGGDPYFYTTDGNPSTLVAPSEVGNYELVYANGDDAILARTSLTVSPFSGDLLAPDEVAAASEFEVAWNGPDGPGDYVTIVPEGATAWAGESYFYTAVGNPGELLAPIDAGEYEVWYVTGDDVTHATRPITVLPVDVTLNAPDSVSAGATFEVEWTGPDGPNDYITIVPAGSPEGTYLDYAYTTEGSPLELTAPDEPGAYEIWYASDRVGGTFESIEIIVN